LIRLSVRAKRSLAVRCHIVALIGHRQQEIVAKAIRGIRSTRPPRINGSDRMHLGEIGLQLRISSEQMQGFTDRLRKQQPIKGVAVQIRQVADSGCVAELRDRYLERLKAR